MPEKVTGNEKDHLNVLTCMHVYRSLFLFVCLIATTSVQSTSLYVDGGIDKPACAPQNTSCFTSAQVLYEPFAYGFPDQANSNSVALFPMDTCNGVALEEATIDQIQEAMNNKSLTSQQLTTCYLRRLNQVDPFINALLELNPDYMAIAEALDAERAADIVRGPLHGMPFLVKDNIATKDKMQTTAGSYALLGSVVPRDAFVVSKLRDAGALLLGKATLSEWADMRSNNYSEGYSARGGQARSPYNLTVNPGGSSSGSAAAVGANAIPFALGTETDGSVINPAERNAVVGIKPTVGLTSRAGVVPESIHQDTVGTFGKTVRDAVYALDAIYGIDARDNYTYAQKGQTPSKSTGYVSYLTHRAALHNATFGLPWTSFWQYADPEQLHQLTALLEKLTSAGAKILNNTELPSAASVISPTGWNWDFGTSRGYPNESEYTVVKTDFYNNINAYLAELQNTPIHTIVDIINYNFANDGTEGGKPYGLGYSGIPAFTSGQDGLIASLETNGTMDETYYQALAFTQRMTREEGIDAVLTNDGNPLSAILVPTDVGQTYQVAAQAGYPMITIPAGTHSLDTATGSSGSGMPFGLGFMHSAFQEGELIKWASAVEDLMRAEGYERDRPKWFGYLEKNVPVLNVDGVGNPV